MIDSIKGLNWYRMHIWVNGSSFLIYTQNLVDDVCMLSNALGQSKDLKLLCVTPLTYEEYRKETEI